MVIAQALYTFRGHTRFAGYWDSPTICGIYLLFALAVLLGLLAFDRQRAFRPSTRLLTYVALCVYSFALVATYSRSAYCTAILFAAILVVIKQMRRIAVIFAIFLSLAFFTLASAPDRLASIVEHGHDASVVNRLYLWKSTAAMIIDRAPVDSDQFSFRAVHQTWYASKPLINAEYRTPVNGYLWFGINYGLSLLALLLFVLCALMTGATLQLKRTKSPVDLMVLLLLITLLLANVFSTVTSNVGINSVAGITTVLLLSRIAYHRGGALEERALYFSPIVGIPLMCVLAVQVQGRDFSAERGYRCDFSLSELSLDSPPLVVRLVPFTRACRAKIFVVSDLLSRRQMVNTSADLAHNGFEVVYLEPFSSSRVGRMRVSKMLEPVTGSLIIVATPTMLRHCISPALLTERSFDLICLPVSWPRQVNEVTHSAKSLFNASEILEIRRINGVGGSGALWVSRRLGRLPHSAEADPVLAITKIVSATCG